MQAEAVPVERVSLGTETVTESQDMTGEVREEHFELHDENGTKTPATDRRS